MALILRLMDELKDRETDRELFSDRPVPSGRVLESDIRASLVTVIVLFIGANLWAGAALWTAVCVLGYALLMFRYFFVPRILRKYLLLNLATHNPVIPILLLYVVVLFSTEQGILDTPLACTVEEQAQADEQDRERKLIPNNALRDQEAIRCVHQEYREKHLYRE